MKNEPLKGKAWCDKCGKPVVETLSVKDIRSAVRGLKNKLSKLWSKEDTNWGECLDEIDKWLKCWDD